MRYIIIIIIITCVITVPIVMIRLKINNECLNDLLIYHFVFTIFTISGWHIHPGLFLPEPGGEVHVQHDDVRLGDGRPGVQQGAQHRGDGGHHLLPVSGILHGK